MASPSPPPADPLPEHPAQWSVADVHRWARTQSAVAAVAPVLRDHAVDGHVLLNYVTNTVLAEELGVTAFGTRVHILEAIETLRWNAGMCPRARYASPPADRSLSPPYARSHSPDSDRARSSKDGSPDPAHPHSKRSASRVADAEKKRQKRAELKKNPVLYAEYLQKERERNARRRARLRAERGRSSSGSNAVGASVHAPAEAAVASRPDAADAYDSSANTFTHATDAAKPTPSYTPFAATVSIHNPLQPPPHNLRHSADASAASASASASDAAHYLRQHDSYTHPQDRPHSDGLPQSRTQDRPAAHVV
ncbi:hypothetical protein IW140_002698 [Coemansia sp. RSA 1813]|nr:hypothetical protein EV178_000226 [Coemansia sp. RSA 1646]KAJ1769528.1 hypothetical protein LPJ74_003947 [Coemansia sp. RSA 1843]KAJ2090466.1 hypothetical protein IW138_002677 [Coemansia sp. RSA 986]KAJ2215433.1 hypothetical protein EV179_002217 [Coemansia sp. RSA 487]KAJ2570022.1 hypothetical protein IW140_002698 [Coemansia sp. RSA 1813]